MSVKFPYTSTDGGGGFGRIVAGEGAGPTVPGVTWNAIDQQLGSIWTIDERLMADSNTAPCILSALAQKFAGRPAYVYLAGENGPWSIDSLHGASCGLAAFLAILGVETDVAVTGYVQAIGVGRSDIPIEPVDSVDRKIAIAMGRRQRLIVPEANLQKKWGNVQLNELARMNNLTTYSFMTAYDGPDVFPIGMAGSVPALGYVLNAMDPTVDLKLFKPTSMAFMAKMKRRCFDT